MSERKKRGTHAADCEATIGLEAVRGVKTIDESRPEDKLYSETGRLKMKPTGSKQPGRQVRKSASTGSSPPIRLCR